MCSTRIVWRNFVVVPIFRALLFDTAGCCQVSVAYTRLVSGEAGHDHDGEG